MPIRSPIKNGVPTRPTHTPHMGAPSQTACGRTLARVVWTERSEEITCPVCRDLQRESDAQQAAFEAGGAPAVRLSASMSEEGARALLKNLREMIGALSDGGDYSDAEMEACEAVETALSRALVTAAGEGR